MGELIRVAFQVVELIQSDLTNEDIRFQPAQLIHEPDRGPSVGAQSRGAIGNREEHALHRLNRLLDSGDRDTVGLFGVRPAALIFCDNKPAIELLEIVSPVS